MALNITPLNYSQLSACDAYASDANGTWSGNSGGTESDFLKEGSACLGFTLRTSGAAPGGADNDVTYTKASGTWDLSGAKHLRLWFLCSTPNAINVEDYGIQFFVGDASNTAYYYLGGRSIYPGGWYNLVVDLSRAASSGTKPTNMLCTKVGLRVNMTSSPKNVDNVWIDNLIYCDGLACDSDTQFSLQDIYDKDNATTGAWGIIRKIGGVYYLAGKIQIGAGSGSTSVDFLDSSQAVVFENRLVNSALYGLNAVGNSGTTKFQLGSKSGTAGISGCTVRTQSLAQTPKFTIGASSLGANDHFKLYGSTFLDAGIVTLPTTTANREVLNCAFESSGRVTASTCIVKNTNFVSSDGAAVLIDSTAHNVTDCNFISCQTAIEHSVGGPSGTPVEYDYDNLKFTGNTYDIENSATTPNYYIDIDRLNGSNPDDGKINNSAGGTTVLLEIGVILQLTGLQDGSDISILTAGTTTERVNVQENAGTTYNYSYSYAVSDYIDVGVFKAGYLPYYQRNYLLGSTNATLPISQRVDRDYLE